MTRRRNRGRQDRTCGDELLLLRMMESSIPSHSAHLIENSLRLLAKMLVAAARNPAPNGPLSPAEMPNKQLDVSAESELMSKAS